MRIRQSTSTRSVPLPRLADVLQTTDDGELSVAVRILEDEGVAFDVRRSIDDGIRYRIRVDADDYERAMELLWEEPP